MVPAAALKPNTIRASKSERISVMVFSSLMSKIERWSAFHHRDSLELDRSQAWRGVRHITGSAYRLVSRLSQEVLLGKEIARL